MDAPRPPSRIALLADLHLACGEHDPFTEDNRLAATIRELLADSPGTPLQLVLLGDTFDFPAVTLPGSRVDPATRPSDAVRKLDAIVDAHPLVVTALRDLLAAGHRVDFVAGNHDMELSMPAVQARLREVLPGAVAVHPWMLYVRGVLYAEHGQQHHDVNRFPGLAVDQPREADDPLSVPAGSYVDALVHLRQRAPLASLPTLVVLAARMGIGLAAALLRLGVSERRRPERERLLGSSPLAGLPSAAVVAIDRLTAASPASITRRAVGLAAGRLRPNAGLAVPYMQSAAQAVHQALAAEGAAVPFYLFGHTHVAADVSLSHGGAVRYLNPGTWSSTTRGVPGGDRRFGVVVVEQWPGDEPRARLTGLV
jgi:UDP-2,3-diacylglucosamine pyrophosphatase LpxH